MGLEFTDDDIKRLIKELDGEKSMRISGVELYSLLARLEAAEAYAKEVHPFDGYNRCEHLYEAWLQSCGREAR